MKSCVKLPGPSGKAKYSWETDSELVPWGKDEKHPEQGSEIVPETIRLQTVGVTLLRDDGVPFAQWAYEFLQPWLFMVNIVKTSIN